MNKMIRTFKDRRDRGAVVLETALAIPILLLVILGSIEFGFAWEAKSASTAGVRTGMLRAASIGDRPDTDLQVLQSIIGEIGAENVDRLQFVAIFDASALPDQNSAIAACQGGGAACAYYDDTFIQTVATTNNNATLLASFDDGNGLTEEVLDAGGNVISPAYYTCDGGKADTGFCASGRTVSGDAEVGIVIQYNHDWATGIFPFTAPQYVDFGVTSTFKKEGADISSSNPIPSNIGQVFQNNFDGGDLGNVSSTSGTVTNEAIRGSDKSLGRFQNETVSLVIDTPQPHNQVCITFDLWIIGSWDNGGNPEWGPDTFQLEIDGSPSPDHPNPVNYARGNDGADLNFGGSAKEGHVVPITACQAHTADQVTIDFTGNMIEQFVAATNMDNEAWAIDNVNVTVSNV